MFKDIPLISVIVPVYNTELYIDRCIKSLLNQTYKNLEIILVNDGSTDKSGIICDKYKKDDKRIKVIHKKNEGVGYARNTGLDNAQGDWIFFLDSDDFLDENALSILYKNAEEQNVDISGCFFYSYYNKNNIQFAATKKDLEVEGLYNSTEFIKLMYNGGYVTGISVIVWNKLYKRSIFKNLRYKNIIHEDEEIIFKIYLNDYKVYFTNKPLYYYSRENENSIMQTKFTRKNLSYLDILDDRIDILKKKKWNDLYKVNLQLFCNMFIEYYYKMQKYDSEFCYEKYENLYERHFKKYIFMKNTNIKTKIRFAIFKLNKNWYKTLFLNT